MSDFIINYSEQIPFPAYAENNKFLPLSSIDGNRRYALYTYNVNPPNISLSAGQISVDVDDIKINNWNNLIDETYTDKPLSADVFVKNQISSIYVNNLNEISAIQVTNLNEVSSIYVNNLNQISAIQVTNLNEVSSIYVNNLNQISAIQVTNLNEISAIQVTNLNEVSAVRITNLNELADNPISFPEVNLDSFNRLRVSNPLTIFDSSHRYRDNNLWATLTAVDGSFAFNQNQGLIDLTVTSASGSSVIRETTKVFSYQPGKSLLVMSTFVFAPSADNLRQRVGYFGADNGVYVQMDDNIISFVERSLVNGSPVTETAVPQSAWNVDKLDGNGPSNITLDITKAQIFWMDIEWLGVGTVRTGFVIDGKFINCHSFHHANRLPATYITTGSLPLRYEITNKAATSGSHTMKQVCSTVISEGGYELRGLQQAIGTTITSPKSLPTAGVFYPIVTIRLNPTRLDGIVILTAISLMGVGTGIYQWRLVSSGTTTGGSGTWLDAGVDSCVQYKLDATGINGGRVVASGYFTSNAQGATTVDVLKEALFKFQLERDAINTPNVSYEISLIVAASTDTELVHGSLDWEEISR